MIDLDQAAVSSYVWTVDISMAKQAFGFAALPSGPVFTAELDCKTKLKDGARLAHIQTKAESFAQVYRTLFPPHVVFVEQPSGGHINLQLCYACSAIQIALSRVLDCTVWTMPSATWKKRTVGNGNAPKDAVLAWAMLHQGAPFVSQDSADTYCMALVGQRMIVSGAWDFDPIALPVPIAIS
jgi:hypothetical protein